NPRTGNVRYANGRTRGRTGTGTTVRTDRFEPGTDRTPNYGTVALVGLRPYRLGKKVLAG
ncbi:hypothetical protein, partial [Labrenzia sp. DG1229]|uniref:hypothetical protein n=1 Tax=Labrenzia sp. DG1229 TaxID=681847 RepID=UPI001AD8F7DF